MGTMVKIVDFAHHFAIATVAMHMPLICCFFLLNWSAHKSMGKFLHGRSIFYRMCLFVSFNHPRKLADHRAIE